MGNAPVNKKSILYEESISAHASFREEPWEIIPTSVIINVLKLHLLTVTMATSEWAPGIENTIATIHTEKYS